MFIPVGNYIKQIFILRVGLNTDIRRNRFQHIYSLVPRESFEPLGLRRLQDIVAPVHNSKFDG